MKVLLSIKPEFAKLIFEGVKKFEFRKSIFKDTNVRTVIVYASSPLQMVIGEFEIETIINDSPENVWRLTREFAGIDENVFYQYFAERDTAYAIKIKKTKRYSKPLCLKKDFKLTPPQSFLYLTD